MFLKLCSNILKTRLKEVKRETATAVYVRQLSAVFFSNLCDMAKEFQFQAFPNNPYCASCELFYSHFTFLSSTSESKTFSYPLNSF